MNQHEKIAEAITVAGARYRGGSDRGGPRRQCRRCGRDLPAEVARVLGDNRGCLDECPECSPRFGRFVTCARRGGDAP